MSGEEFRIDQISKREIIKHVWSGKPCIYDQSINGKSNRVALSINDRRKVSKIVKSIRCFSYLKQRLKHEMSSFQTETQLQHGFAFHNIQDADWSKVKDIALEFIAKYENYLNEPDGYPSTYVEEANKAATDPVNHAPCQNDEEKYKALIKFGLSPEILEPVSRYFNHLPRLAATRVLYSPNRNDDGSTSLRQSQLFHIDPEGFMQVKVFIALEPVENENSPLTFLDSRQTEKLFNLLNLKRFPDDQVAQHIPKEKWKVHRGNPGQSAFVDTSRCLHCGSRPNLKPRKLLFYQFLNEFSGSMNIVKSRKFLGGLHSLMKNETNLTPQQRYVLSLD